MLWAQLLEEVERRPRLVLLVTNENKKAEEWLVQQPGGRSPLPRPELSAEVWGRAGQSFHIVNVRSFLELANEFLDAQVSDETITQAQEIEASFDVSTLTPVERSLYNAALPRWNMLGSDLYRSAAALQESLTGTEPLTSGLLKNGNMAAALLAVAAALSSLAPRSQPDDPDPAADRDEPHDEPQ